MNESFRILKYSGNAQPPYVEGDTKVQSLNFGLRYKFWEAKSISLRAGLDLTSYGFMDRKITVVRWPSEITPQGYIFDPSLPHELHNGRKFIYLEMPIAGMLKKSFNKWTPNIQLEIIPQYLISYKSISNTDIGNSSRLQSPPDKYNKFNFAAGVTIGTYYSLSSTVSILVNCFYRRQFLDIIEAPMTAKLYALGINVGVGFDIN